MKNKKTKLPNVWNYAKKVSDIPEGAIGINTNNPDKLRIFQGGKWEEFAISQASRWTTRGRNQAAATLTIVVVATVSPS